MAHRFYSSQAQGFVRCGVATPKVAVGDPAGNAQAILAQARKGHEAGADLISVHPESGPHLSRTLQLIRSQGCKAGVVFNPSTSPTTIEGIMDQVDLILVMSVNPGFGGQKFMTSQLAKIRRLREMIDATGREIHLEVDGGVTPETAPLCVEAGATALVAGTAVFKGGADAYAANITALRGG
jgi:ribulose-phosphate 3-epimerase